MKVIERYLEVIYLKKNGKNILVAIRKYKEEIQNDPTFAGKLGTWLNYAGRTIGTNITNVAEVALNVVADIGKIFLSSYYLMKVVGQMHYGLEYLDNQREALQ